MNEAMSAKYRLMKYDISPKWYDIYGSNNDFSVQYHAICLKTADLWLRWQKSRFMLKRTEDGEVYDVMLYWVFDDRSEASMLDKGLDD